MPNEGGQADPSHKEAGSLLATSPKMNEGGPMVSLNTWGKLPGCQSTLSEAQGYASQNNYRAGFMLDPRVFRPGVYVCVFTPANVQNYLIREVLLGLCL